MKKLLLALGFVLLAVGLLYLLTSGTFTSSPPRIEDTDTANTTAEPALARSLPKASYWFLADKPFASKGDVSIGIHLADINPERTTLIYSVTTLEQIGMSDLDPRLLENGKRTLLPTANTVLGKWGNLQIGALTFEPATVRGPNLSLQVKAPGMDSELILQVTKNVLGELGDAPLEENDAQIVAYDECFIQAPYSICFNGLLFFTDDLQAIRKNDKGQTLQQVVQAAADAVGTPKSPGPLPTPAPAPPPAALTELANGQPVRTDATLRIENLETHEVKFLYYVILDDGQVRSKIVE